jgi:uncharacterized membrane protein HdeD (DUF308 family)
MRTVLLVDLGVAAILAAVVLIVAPGLAIVAIVAAIVLVVAGITLLVGRLRSRKLRRVARTGSGR